MAFVVASPPRRSLTVEGTEDRFPVNRIFCVGRNYAAHAREMGSDPSREAPFFFMKPAQAAVDGARKSTISYPSKTQNFHYEVELVVGLARGGVNIPAGRALEHVYGYACGLDMTRRDVQQALRDKGRPWELAKSFSQSAPVGVLRQAGELGEFPNAPIELKVNGETRQSSHTGMMMWSVAECIAELSAYEELEPGDLLFTGTPEGVGPCVRGDTLRGSVGALPVLEIVIGT
jgi:fumarylpyruvate hydrolase